MAELSALSNQTIWQPVTLTHPIDGAQNPTSGAVELAIVVDKPVATDWFPAAWEATTDSEGRYVAYAEVGPGSNNVTLEAGLYRVWVRLTLATETPVLGGEFVVVY